MEINQYIERDSELIRLADGKKVLHLGCVGFTDGTHAEKIALAKSSLHARLSEVALECTGVDLDGDAIRELRDLKVFTNVIEGDVQKLSELPDSLGDYDLVIAGDIIEHISNPGLMLKGIHSFMKPGGRLIVSTPNAFGIASYIKYLRGSFREGAQHVLCFNPITLRQLLERNGFEIENAYSCYQSRAASLYGRTFRIFRTLLEYFPHLGGTLLVICLLKQPPADS
jgi:2-polyprenyl-3-methyl-5-hydroxy-6-metoxy-1,4-benzoquinol methylase